MMVHPYVLEMLAHERQAELERDARRARRGAKPPAAAPAGAADRITIRCARAADVAAVEALHALNGLVPTDAWLVADLDGAVAAALTADGVAVADPFRPSAHLVSLLSFRAEQLAPRARRFRLRGRRALRPAI
jgi:hypothetical protein